MDIVLKENPSVVEKGDERSDNGGSLGLFIQAGVTFFYENGYVGTTIEEIAARAGFTKGAFY